MPTYPSGQIGFVLCSPKADYKLNTPVRALSSEVLGGLQYYSPDIHSASFVLPQFARKSLAL